MNGYDQVQLDVNSLLKRPLRSRSQLKPAKNTATQVLRKLEFYTKAFLFRTGIWRRLIITHFTVEWFDDFRRYWVHELGMRHIDLPDFYYLRSSYRSQFQSVAITASQEKKSQDFLAPWQSPQTIYLLFSYVYKLSLNPITIWQIRRFVKRGDAVCEYGCGVAPVTSNFARYYQGLKLKLTAIDIPNIMLHYARWRLQKYPNVEVVELNPDSNNPLTKKYNLITCLTVFEHLPRPLPIVQHIYNQLHPGGYFVFDFIKAEGSGLDTTGSVNQRQPVLDFIRQNFKIISGHLPNDSAKSVSLVICQKNDTANQSNNDD